MGLDSVEIVLSVEETFSIDLPDNECASADTVGKLFQLVLSKLQLPYRPVVELEASATGRDFSEKPLQLQQWTSADVWMTLRSIITDQLQVDLDEVKEGSSFVHDLGCI